MAEEAAEEPQSEAPKVDPNDDAQKKEKIQDCFTTEFIYYGSVLKIVAPTLSSDADREAVTPWIKKLFQPEYQTLKLREKRNRYLVKLTINLLNDEVSGAFTSPVPETLPCWRTMTSEPSQAAEWELDNMWQETLLALPEDFKMMECPVHGTNEECQQDRGLDKILDQEFQFLLYLARPYAALLTVEDKTRTATWLQTLCTIHGKTCSSFKSMRNDYLMTLLGYLHDLRLVGPFLDYPPIKTLKPLSEAVEESSRLYPVTDPTGPEANEFLIDQPVPDDGAFCYIALTGDLVSSNL